MTTSRETVLARTRAALTGKNAHSGAIPRNYQRSVTSPPGAPETIELLIHRLFDYGALVARSTPADLPDTIASVLANSTNIVIPVGLDAAVAKACGRDGRSVSIDGEPTALSATELDCMDTVVTAARAAIAISGTVILDGAPDQGRRAITLVPDRHVVILHAHQIVTTVAEAVGMLNPVRPLTMIAGPSATSDIELERVEGVHGPRTLQVVIVTDAFAALPG